MLLPLGFAMAYVTLSIPLSNSGLIIVDLALWLDEQGKYPHLGYALMYIILI